MTPKGKRRFAVGGRGRDCVLCRLNDLGQGLVECRGQKDRDALDRRSSILFLLFSFILKLVLLILLLLLGLKLVLVETLKHCTTA